MTDLEKAQRAAVVAEALSWDRTPYHHAARIKGTGCDCAMFPAEVYHAVGLIPRIEVEAYPMDWNLHRDTERYLDVVEAHARRFDGPPGPGDFVIYRWGRTMAHGVIVIEWPRVIHSVRGIGVTQDDAARNAKLADPSRERRFYTLW